MNIKEDILAHRYSARQFYQRLRATTIVEAYKEPLRLRDIATMPNRVTLPSGNVVPFCQALCYVCVNHLLSFFRRKSPMNESDKEYIAERMMIQYPNWSVLDLPTFVTMVIGSRVPTVRMGETEYELVLIDIPNIMAKLEAYDRMRPHPETLQGNSPNVQTQRPLTEYKLHHLIDGTPYDFAVPYEDFVQGYTTPSGDPRINAERYWNSRPNYGNDQIDTALIDRVCAKVQTTRNKLKA